MRFLIFLHVIEKPEWFKMTEGDQKPLEIAPKSKNHLFKVAAFTAPLLIVGAIAVGAIGEAEEEENAPAFDTTLTTTSSSTTAIPAVNNASQQSSTSNTSPKFVTVANSAAPTLNSGSKVGVGVPMPTGKGGDDEQEGHEKRDGHDDDDDDFGDDD